MKLFAKITGLIALYLIALFLIGIGLSTILKNYTDNAFEIVFQNIINPMIVVSTPFYIYFILPSKIRNKVKDLFK